MGGLMEWGLAQAGKKAQSLGCSKVWGNHIYKGIYVKSAEIYEIF